MPETSQKNVWQGQHSTAQEGGPELPVFIVNLKFPSTHGGHGWV